MDGVRTTFSICLLGALMGCAAAPEAPFPNWTGSSSADPPSGAYDGLARAAVEAERLSGADLDRVSFTPGKRTALIEKLAGPMKTAAEASREPASMPDRSADPFEALPHQKGWRMIGRALSWKVERSVALQDFDEALHATIDATRFGLALTAGSASDACLGYQIVNDARSAFAPAIGKLSPGQLRELGTGIEAALRRRPEARAPAENERRTMLRAVQSIQDAFRDRKLGTLIEELGRDIEPAVDYLEKLRAKDSFRRAEYFAKFAAEAEMWADHYSRGLGLNARQRELQQDPALAEERPWRRFANHFFQSLDTVIRMRDETIARTRLLGLTALLLAECKANGTAPSSLVGISNDLTIDPYSGQPMAYRPDGARFMLYSMGHDLKDDGGETDGLGRSPDLRLEGERS